MDQWHWEMRDLSAPLRQIQHMSCWNYFLKKSNEHMLFGPACSHEHVLPQKNDKNFMTRPCSGVHLQNLSCIFSPISTKCINFFHIFSKFINFSTIFVKFTFFA